MPVQNSRVAEVLEQVADLLEIEGANPFRVRAYRTAALTVRSLPSPLHALLRAGEDLTELPGIGADLAGKLAEIVETGRLALVDELTRETPPGLLELLDLPGLGPKRVRALQRELGVKGRADLLRAARAGRLRAVKGFGPKTEAAVLAALGPGRVTEKRMRWSDAEPTATELVTFLEGLEGVAEVVVAGSFRRRQETVGDLDVLVTCRRGVRVAERLRAHEDVAEVLAAGETKTTLRLRSGLQVDVRLVPRESYGAALVYFTGSKAHNIALRRLALEKGLKINEYGVFRGPRRVAGRTEREVYRSVGLRFVPPELREDRGEVEAARRGRLPRLVELADVRGDLHVHTVASDGHATIEEMARAAKARGYEYVAIADHSRAARIAHGLDPARMRRHLRAIERADGRLPGIRLLRSAEVDVLEDGRLDLPGALLAEMDLVLCAVHSHFRLSAAKQTERILRAMDDSHVHVLGHPTGRLIGERAPYAVDLERVIAGAAERGVLLELDAQPARLDLPDVELRAAKEVGARIAISSDAHRTEQLDFMRLGIGQARRGWLEPGDVANTRPWGVLKRLLRR